MGTYAVTHLKKDNKIIPLSDSYDGYLSGMGLANLLSIKHIPTEHLKSLFDAYTAIPAVLFNPDVDIDEQYDENEKPIDQRTLENALFQVSEDCEHNPEVFNWFKDAIHYDIRTSTCGFAPLLYLNHSPHYGRDYYYCDYLVDLDNEVFVIHGNCSIPFSLIQSAEVNHLHYFADESYELLTGDNATLSLNYFVEKIQEFTSNDGEAIPQEQIDTVRLKDIQQELDAFIASIFALPIADIDEIYLAQEKEQAAYRQKYAEEQEQKKSLNKEVLENENGYSIYNAREISLSKLRLILSFLQRLAIYRPETSFMLKNAEWGMAEDGQSGSILFFSPMTSNDAHYELYSVLIALFEYEFKISFSIFSSSGQWSHDVKPTENNPLANLGFGSFFAFDTVPGPEQSLFTLEEVHDFPDANYIFSKLDPMLGIHCHYQEVRYLLLSNENLTIAPIFYMYFAILHQDKEVMEKLYPLAKDQLATVSDPKILNKVFSTYLETLSDSDLVADKLMMINNKDVVLNNQLKEEKEAFHSYLKTTDFIKDLVPYMNKKEKAYFEL